MQLMKLIHLLCMLAFVQVVHAQQSAKTKKEKFPSYFGISLSPVIPNNFIGAIHTSFQDSAQSMHVDYKNKWGLTFGGTVRIGLSKRIALETGISQVRRIYEVNTTIPDSNVATTSKLAFINYDIPLNALFYVQLSETWYMDASAGISITHYPSDVRKISEPSSKETVTAELRRTERTYFALNTGIGFEYRTEKIGNFFLGFGAKVPFKQPYFGVVIYEKSGYGKKTTAFAPISGGYFTIDFRYFIPSVNNKNRTNKALID